MVFISEKLNIYGNNIPYMEGGEGGGVRTPLKDTARQDVKNSRSAPPLGMWTSGNVSFEKNNQETGFPASTITDNDKFPAYHDISHM